MSALDNLINNTNGLIVHLPLTDASKASAPTLAGPNAGSLVSSWGVGAVAGASAIVPGDSASVSLPAVTNSYLQIAANSLLLPANDMTAEIFINRSAASSVDMQFFGMSLQQNWIIYSRSNNAVGGQVQDSRPIGLVVADTVTSLTGLVHVVLKRFGDRVELIVNGNLAVAKQDLTGSLRQTSQILRVGNVNPGTLAMQVAHAAYYSRALTMGEIRARCELAGIATSLQPLPVERSSDLSGKGVARGTTIYEAASGTSISRNEQHVIDADGQYWEAASYAATKPDFKSPILTLPSVPSPANELAIHTSRLILEGLEVWTKQRYSGDQTYFSNGQWLDTRPQTPQEWRNVLGVPVSAAILHRYGGGGRNSWLYKLAYDSFESVINLYQDTSTGNIGSDNFWVLIHLPTIYMALYPMLDRHTRNRWSNALVASAEYEYANNGTYYVNGNIEFARTHCWWFLWQITGEVKWLGRMETQFANAQIQSGTSPQSGFGWVTTVAPTQPDGSDGAGYFREAGSGAPGFDWNYTAFQAAIGARLYSDTNDTRFLKIANMCWNTIEGLGQGGISRITRRDNNYWTLDTTGGTRHDNATDNMDTPYPAIVAFKAGRTSFANDAASMVRSCGYTLRGNYNSSGLTFRQHGDVLGEILKVSAPDFPDLRLR